MTLAIQPEEWYDDALCVEVGGDFWFAERGESTKEAKQVCKQCPVQPACLEYALRTNQRYGVWGGLSERARGKLKRDMRRAAA